MSVMLRSIARTTPAQPRVQSPQCRPGRHDTNRSELTMKIVWTLLAVLAISTSVSAQPFGRYLRMQGFPQHGYIEIPDDVLLDTPAMTVEAWVSVRDPRSGACSSITGKGYNTG